MIQNEYIFFLTIQNEYVILNLDSKRIGKEAKKMRIDRSKYMLARARACMGQKELEAAGIPKGTLCRALRADVKPETIGKIAKALGVDVLEIIEAEE